MVELGVMVLGHRRPQLLSLIAEQICRQWPACAVDITLDRPNIEVVKAAHLAQRFPQVRVHAAPFPVVADREYFMEMRNWQLTQLRPLQPKYVALWDDDHLLEDPDEAARVMRVGADLIYVDKVYFWDHPEQYNSALPRHRSPLIFRYRDGDKYPLDRTINAPAGVHDDPHAKNKVLYSRLLDFGYMHEDERLRVFEIYKRAGKIDQLTMGLVSPPALKKFFRRGHDSAYEQFKKAVA
jgi:hypothetical protein